MRKELESPKKVYPQDEAIVLNKVKEFTKYDEDKGQFVTNWTILQDKFKRMDFPSGAQYLFGTLQECAERLALEERTAKPKQQKVKQEMSIATIVRSSLSDVIDLCDLDDNLSTQSCTNNNNNNNNKEKKTNQEKEIKQEFSGYSSPYKNIKPSRPNKKSTPLLDVIDLCSDDEEVEEEVNNDEVRDNNENENQDIDNDKCTGDIDNDDNNNYNKITDNEEKKDRTQASTGPTRTGDDDNDKCNFGIDNDDNNNYNKDTDNEEKKDRTQASSGPTRTSDDDHDKFNFGIDNDDNNNYNKDTDNEEKKDETEASTGPTRTGDDDNLSEPKESGLASVASVALSLGYLDGDLSEWDLQDAASFKSGNFQNDTNVDEMQSKKSGVGSEVPVFVQTNENPPQGNNRKKSKRIEQQIARANKAQEVKEEDHHPAPKLKPKSKQKKQASSKKRSIKNTKTYDHLYALKSFLSKNDREQKYKKLSKVEKEYGYMYAIGTKQKKYGSIWDYIKANCSNLLKATIKKKKNELDFELNITKYLVSKTNSNLFDEFVVEVQEYWKEYDENSDPAKKRGKFEVSTSTSDDKKMEQIRKICTDLMNELSRYRLVNVEGRKKQKSNKIPYMDSYFSIYQENIDSTAKLDEQIKNVLALLPSNEM